MFTGIVEELRRGRRRVEPRGARPPGSPSAGPLVTQDAAHGDSIAVNGVCLTVVELGRRHVHRRRDGRDAEPHRARRRSRRRPGQPGARGARSATGSAGTSSRATSTASARASSARPASAGRPRSRCRPALARYVVEKGSIAVDGVSLTVVAAGRRTSVRRRR